MNNRFDYNPNLYYKTLICDFDDTLAFSLTKDWSNSKPNIKMIEKINKLYDLGWQIIILTARGQLSCNGDFIEADKKYRIQIENWLKNNNVKYHKLSFKKYLGLYYIDDKNINNQEFEDIEIKEIETGLSGAEIFKIDNKIYKTSENTLNEILWYQKVQGKINIPIIYSYIGKTICMEHLSINSCINLNHIISTIESLKSIENSNNSSFETYIERIKNHCIYNKIEYTKLCDILYKYKNILDKYKTFCHGDFSLDNMIETYKGLYLIDPIYNTNLYSSYLLDVSKLLYSLRTYNRDIEYEYILIKYSNEEINKQLLQLLEITQMIRTIKYTVNEEKRNMLITQTNKYIDTL